jgi:hypothetical protein
MDRNKRHILYKYLSINSRAGKGGRQLAGEEGYGSSRRMGIASYFNQRHIYNNENLKNKLKINL